MSTERQYTCAQCGNNYKHRQSLHRHKTSCNGAQSSENVSNMSIPAQDCFDNKKSKLTCDNCDKEYKHIQSKNRHMKTCTGKNYETEINNLKKLVNELLIKVNNPVSEINNINSNNIINNNINNTINIVALGKENINELLSKAEKINILNKKANALPYMIEYMHFNNKFPQFKNIAITNSKSLWAHVYNVNEKKFQLVDKTELVEELIDYRVCDIEEYYTEYKDELEEPVQHKIEELLEHRGENTETYDKIKLLLFNNRHKIDIKCK